MSTADEPRPIEPLTLTSEAAWRRLELTSTSVWSGARPRRAAGRTVSVPSLSAGRGKLNEGSATDSAWFTSDDAALLRGRRALTTSTATAVSSAVRSATRVPVTMMTSSLAAPSVAPAPGRTATALQRRPRGWRTSMPSIIMSLSHCRPSPWAVSHGDKLGRRASLRQHDTDDYVAKPSKLSRECDPRSDTAPSGQRNSTRAAGEACADRLRRSSELHATTR